MTEKQQHYQRLYKQIEALLAGERNVIAIMANTSACLYQSLNQINWAGFYLWDEDELILGPFQGRPACIHIANGKGVCGACTKEKRVLRIDNVHTFPGHIACDSASRSEIVFPLYKEKQLLGVLDIDAPICARFDQEDENGLTSIVQLLENLWNTN